MSTGAVVVIVVLAWFAWLAWSRYLNHKEVRLLIERPDGCRAVVEMKNRWWIRTGILLSVSMICVGAVMIVGTVVAGTAVLPKGTYVAAALTWTGILLVIEGLAQLVAYLIWSRGKRTTVVREGPESRA